ncbi:uncharacterized protein LOC121370148 [Gigantopelta aegis]|uniref:uncharacterized protein LOC121370148 n=1 Tax=Gigantopelta aegis TaxID=1735272 RepID=UPI001B88ABA2|nr:uncharacterized protein LOC121370148 [Gigantopelta aegis]
MDGMIQIVKAPFYQLLSIHAFVRANHNIKMLPMVFVSMSRRRTIDYVKVLRQLLQLLPEEPVMTHCVMDFEMATWKAVAKVFPDVKLRGCLFHLTQAVWRKCQEIGLQVAYMNDDATHKFIIKIMALSFLPAREIHLMYNKIERLVPRGGKLELIQYVGRQWMDRPIFVPRCWSIFGVTVRTNNHVEGWHHRINNKVGDQPQGIYKLIPELYKEARLLPIQTRMVQEGNLRTYIRETATIRQEDFFQVWGEYKDGELSLSQLLGRCAAIHGPVTN